MTITSIPLLPQTPVQTPSPKPRIANANGLQDIPPNQQPLYPDQLKSDLVTALQNYAQQIGEQQSYNPQDLLDLLSTVVPVAYYFTGKEKGLLASLYWGAHYAIMLNPDTLVKDLNKLIQAIETGVPPKYNPSEDEQKQANNVAQELRNLARGPIDQKQVLSILENDVYPLLPNLSPSSQQFIEAFKDALQAGILPNKEVRKDLGEIATFITNDIVNYKSQPPFSSSPIAGNRGIGMQLASSKL